MFENKVKLKTSSTEKTENNTNTQSGNSSLADPNNVNGSKFQKISPLPKPDFSSIEKKESSFAYKQKGSYKKPRSMVPESPMKSPNQRIFTPVKLNTDFNTLTGISNQSTCRKLTFNEKFFEDELPKINSGNEKESNFIESFKQNNHNVYPVFDKMDEDREDFYENHLNHVKPDANKSSETNFNLNRNFDYFTSSTKNGNEKNNLFTSLFMEDDADRGDSSLEQNINKEFNLNRIIHNTNDKNFDINNKLGEVDDSYMKGDIPNTNLNKFTLKFGNKIDIDLNISEKFIQEKKDLLTFNDLDSSMTDINEIDSTNRLQSFESKFEKEFLIIKTIEAGVFGIVYQCLNKTENKIYAVKKSKKHSSLSDFNSIQNLNNDFNLKKFDIFSEFCVNSKECWLENESHEHTLLDDHLYISQDFCLFGDLLNYLEKIENVNTPENLILTESFYWDLIFEMMCGIHFVHKCEYVHLDVKPGNFLVTENGGVKIGDFGLTKKIKDIRREGDINEGDSSYLAPEFFGELKKKFIINTKCDVFSLGLSVLEILCKVEIPQHGVMWNEIRSREFTIPPEFLKNSNIKINDKMVKLIMNMLIIDPEDRPDIIQIFENEYFDEINFRYKALINGCYKRSFDPSGTLKHDKFLEISYFNPDELEKIIFSKRSNSYKYSEEMK